MSAQDHQWIIRNDGEHPKLSDLYGDYNTLYTSLKIIHGGKFTPSPGRDYVRPKVTIVDSVNVHNLSYELLSDIIKALKYNGEAYFYRIEKAFSLDVGLIKLEIKSDFDKFFDFLFPTNCTQLHTIYVEHNTKSQIACFPNSLRKAKPQVIENLLFDFLVDNRNATNQQAKEYVFKKYGVWITPYYLNPGLYRVRMKLDILNGDD